MSRSRIIVFTAAALLGSGFLLWSGLQSKENRALASKAKVTAPEEGAPWNGGKSSPPIRVSSSLSGRVEPDAFHDFTLSFRALETCTRLISRVRGLDGVLIQDESEQDHGACDPSREIQRNGALRAPGGTAGFLVVDLEYHTGNEVMATSRSFVIQTTDQAPLKKLGGSKPGRDEQGNPIIILKSEASGT